jgi:hypothetical protein
MKCHECRRAFTPRRTDQVFHNTKCRMKWFGRKAKAAMKVFECLLDGNKIGARAAIADWKADAESRAAQ